MFMEHGFGGGFMWIFWMIIIVALIWVTASFTNINTGKDKTALDLLEERYAKGEIGQKDFTEMKKHLQS